MTEEEKKISADEYRRISREAVIEYLNKHTSVEERKAVFKAALTEWMNERFSEFGWFSFKALAVVGFAAMMTLWLYTQGWHK